MTVPMYDIRIQHIFWIKVIHVDMWMVTSIGVYIVATLGETTSTRYRFIGPISSTNS